MSDARPKPDPGREQPFEIPREELGPPFFATLTVGQRVDDRTVEEAGENPEARL